MKSVRQLLVALVTLGILAPAADRVGAQDEGTRWTWTAQDLKLIKDLEKKVQKKDDRFVLETADFAVETEISARFTAELSRFMQLFFAAVGGFFKADASVSQKLTIVVFAQEASYRKLFDDGSRGYFSYRWDENGVWTNFHLHTYVEKEEQKEFSNFYHPILLHEGTHALLRRIAGKRTIAPWFNEGMASYFQFWNLRDDVERNLKKHYERSFRRKHLKEHCAAAPEREARMADLLAVTPETWNPDRMGPVALHHYAIAESLADYLIVSKRSFVNTVLNRVLAEETPLVSDEEIKQIEPLWHKRLKQVGSSP